MAKRPDKPVYSFVRKGNALWPELEYDAHALDGIAQGQRVRVDIKEWRNVERLRAYWAMLHDVVAATGANRLTAERLHEGECRRPEHNDEEGRKEEVIFFV